MQYTSLIGRSPRNGRRGRRGAHFIDLTNTMVDSDIQEVGEATTYNDISQGDLNRLQREVVDSISFESADVTSVNSLLHIPFDYEELMRDNTDGEHCDAASDSDQNIARDT